MNSLLNKENNLLNEELAVSSVYYINISV